MFYMPGTRMLFGDAKDTCDGQWPGFVVNESLIDENNSDQAWAGSAFKRLG